MLLPGVDQLFSEPAGQRLTHPVEQLGELNVVIPVVLPEERLRLKTDVKTKKKNELKQSTKVEEKQQEVNSVLLFKSKRL